MKNIQKYQNGNQIDSKIRKGVFFGEKNSLCSEQTPEILVSFRSVYRCILRNQCISWVFSLTGSLWNAAWAFSDSLPVTRGPVRDISRLCIKITTVLFHITYPYTFVICASMHHYIKVSIRLNVA